MNADQIKIRKIQPRDVPRCAEILFQAFKGISEAHGFPPDFSDPSVPPRLMKALVGHKKFFGCVALRGKVIVGSNFMDQRGTIAGIGPITVDPAEQNASVGKQLMLAALEHARKENFAGVRLVQAAFHNRSLSLYAKLGFVVREPLACMQGKPPANARFAGATVRAMTDRDINACDGLCMNVHGHTRHDELVDAVERKLAAIVERGGRVTGYTSLLGFFGHTLGETNEDVKALLASAERFDGPGILVPTRNAELFRWCLENGLRVTQPMTLMSMGMYNQPQGSFLPSILY